MRPFTPQTVCEFENEEFTKIDSISRLPERNFLDNPIRNIFGTQRQDHTQQSQLTISRLSKRQSQSMQQLQCFDHISTSWSLHTSRLLRNETRIVDYVG